MYNSASLQVDKNSHVVMSFFDAELIDSQEFDLMDRNLAIETVQLVFMDFFDHISANIEKMGNVFNYAKTQ